MADNGRKDVKLRKNCLEIENRRENEKLIKNCLLMTKGMCRKMSPVLYAVK